MFVSRLVRLPLISRNNFFHLNQCYIRPISTSKRSSDSSSTNVQACPATPKPKSTWQPYGFGRDEVEDRIHMHLMFFFGISVCVVGIVFYAAYSPTTHDWEQREAFFELRRREKLGLPAIDPNYVDPNTIDLPSDEELGDTEIII